MQQPPITESSIIRMNVSPMTMPMTRSGNNHERPHRDHCSSDANIVIWNIRAANDYRIICNVTVSCQNSKKTEEKFFNSISISIVPQAAMVRSLSDANAVHCTSVVRRKRISIKSKPIHLSWHVRCAANYSKNAKVCTITWSSCMRSRKSQNNVECVRNVVSIDTWRMCVRCQLN